jgi:hypothetical protein
MNKGPSSFCQFLHVGCCEDIQGFDEAIVIIVYKNWDASLVFNIK